MFCFDGNARFNTTTQVKTEQNIILTFVYGVNYDFIENGRIRTFFYRILTWIRTRA